MAVCAPLRDPALVSLCTLRQSYLHECDLPRLGGNQTTARIALFNHKGGVSKTTTAFNLGWMLASKGQKVILADADPQCNLTGMVLNYRGPAEFEKFYETDQTRNLRAGLSPAFDSKPQLIEAVDCIPVQGRDGLFLLPGHIGIAEYEVTLGIAQQLSGPIMPLKNLPGSFSYLLEKTAAKFNADYVLVDMSPSLSSINQNLLVTSDFFIVPTSPDYFSVMALESLASILPKWHALAKQLSSLSVLKEANYPFPAKSPRFLGTIVQKYRPRGGGAAAAFQEWIDEINNTVTKTLVPALRGVDMLIADGGYPRDLVEKHYCLAQIPDFNSLIAISQTEQTPVFALKPDQIGQVGVVLDQTLKARDNFNRLFSDLADQVLGLTRHEQPH